MLHLLVRRDPFRAEVPGRNIGKDFGPASMTVYVTAVPAAHERVV